MRTYISLLAIVFLASCTAVKLSVPDKFEKQSTRMQVKGINGWQVGQKLSFGNYQTSNIKRGWDFSSSISWTKFSIRPEETLAKVFFDINNQKEYQRSKFQYVIEDGNLIAEVYANEKFSERELVYKSNNPWIGEASKTKNYNYNFSAAIVPLKGSEKEPWSLVMISKYDIKKDTARKLFDKPYVEEEGVATNGKETINIRPLRVSKVNTKSGVQMKVFGGNLLTGYELTWDGGVVAIIDILDNSIRIYNDLDASDKLILSSISSAILLKKMQDVEKDRDN